jgi:hypothetical protein
VVTAANVSNINTDAADSLVRPSYPSTIFITATYDTCNFEVISDKDYIIYKHTVVVKYGSNPNPNVIREEKDMYDVMCLRNRTAHIIIETEGFNNTMIRMDGHVSQSKLIVIGLFSLRQQSYSFFYSICAYLQRNTGCPVKRQPIFWIFNRMIIYFC